MNAPNPIGIVINRPKGDPKRLRHKGRPTIMEDGSVCITCKDEQHHKHWVSFTPAMIEMLAKCLREHGPTEINRLETTPAGVIDWKMEAERANRLLTQSQCSAATVDARRTFLDGYWPYWREDTATQRFVDIKAAFDAGRASVTASAPQEAPDTLMLMQARYVLKNLHAERPGCGYDKLADACGDAASTLSRPNRS